MYVLYFSVPGPAGGDGDDDDGSGSGGGQAMVSNFLVLPLFIKWSKTRIAN